MLPDPAVTLTIPSLHGGTTLDCCVYHPGAGACFGAGLGAGLGAEAALAPHPGSPSGPRRAVAVLAHPYAPMGGCSDDVVVGAVAAQLLRAGYVVGTFNFRGAGRSAGRTSWSARPEGDDYASFVGFMVCYVDGLDPPSAAGEPPLLLMGGYSYGALVTAQLGPLEAVVAPFEAPAAGTPAAEIRRRAEQLAAAAVWTRQQQQPGSPGRRSGVRVGCDEGPPRRSRDCRGRRSFAPEADADDDDDDDGPRSRLGGFLARRRRESRGNRTRPGSRARRMSATASEPSSESPRTPPVRVLAVPRAAYLLVSPLQGLVAHLATMSLVPRPRRHGADDAAEAKLTRNPTLAVYGNGDVLVPAGRLRAWARRLSDAPGSLFRMIEVAQAGHFWTDAGALGAMEGAVGRFARGLLKDG